MLVKFVKIIFLLTVASTILFSIHWVSLNKTEKQHLQQLIKQIRASNRLTPSKERFLDSDDEAHQLTSKKMPKQSQALLPRVVLSEQQSSNALIQQQDNSVEEQFDRLARLNSEYWEETSLPKACGRVKTKVLKEVEIQQVYSWRDEKGKMHFSDQKPVGNLSVPSFLSPDITVTEFEREQKLFHLTIIKGHADMQAVLGDRIRSDVKAIYSLLAQSLGFNHLREVDITLRLFSKQDEFQRYKNKVAPGSTTNTGFYLSSINEASVVQWANRPERTYAVVRHESSHVIIASLLGATPRWFNEGLAEYFELLTAQSQHRRIDVDENKLNYLKQQLDEKKLPSIETLWSLKGREFYQNPQLHYSMAWSLIHFMLNDETTKKVFLALIKTLYNNPCESVDMLSLVNTEYNGGLKAFEQAFLMSIRTNTLKPHYY